MDEEIKFVGQVLDNVHGFIPYTAAEKKIMETQLFKRLQRAKKISLFVLENSHEKETITGRMGPLSPMSKVSRIMYSSGKKITGIAGLTI